MNINLIHDVISFIDHKGAASVPEILNKFHLTPELFREIIQYMLLQEIISDASMNSPPSCDTFKCKFCPYAKSCGTKIQLNHYTLRYHLEKNSEIQP